MTTSYWSDKLRSGYNQVEWPTYSSNGFGKGDFYPISEDTQKSIQKISGNQPMAEWVLFLSAYRSWLFRVFGQVDTLIYAPSIQASSFPLNSISPLFYDIKTEETDTWQEIVNKTRKEIQALVRHMEYDYEDWCLQHPEGARLRGVWQTFGISDSSLQQEGNFEEGKLHLNINKEKAGEWQVSFSSSDEEMGKDELNEWAESFVSFLSTITQQAKLPITSLPLASTKQQERIQGFEQIPAQADFVVESVVELWNRQAIATPEKQALVFQDNDINYQALNEQSNQIANYLISNNVKANDPIAVLLDRSEKSVISIISILKAGGTYVPIDPNWPSQRTKLVIEDCSPAFIICEEKSTENFQDIDVPVLTWESQAWSGASNENPGITPAPSDHAYYIYTSGSTGKPKGVMQTYSTLNHLISWQIQSSPIETGLSYAQYASFGFDVSMQDVCFVLASGGSMHVLDELTRLDLAKLISYFNENEIETTYLPTAVLSNLFATQPLSSWKGNSLKHIITAGEQLILSPKIKSFLKKYPQVQLHNHYGPSETHVVSTLTLQGETDSPRKVSIGKPVTHTRLQVLDKNKQVLPPYVAGELYIFGPQLAAGYLNREEATKERFFEIEQENGETATAYSSGDLAYWNSNGELVFIGRQDDQVKVNGYRIELGEIEQVLQSFPALNEAVATLQTSDSGEVQLVAFYTSEQLVDQGGLMEHCQAYLPSYMVPPRQIRLTKLPLTHNGKLDRAALRQAWLEYAETESYLPPSTPLEMEIAEVWGEILNRQDIGINDSFFALGGHSLKVMQMINRIQQRVGVELSLREVFDQPTISELIKLIEGKQAQSFQSIQKAEESKDYPLSHAQKRLWVFHQLDESQAAYNMPMTHRMDEAPDLELFTQSFQYLLERHESLRTIFISKEGEARQKILSVEEVSFSVETADLQGLNQAELESKLFEWQDEIIRRPFDLGEAPLWRVGLAYLPEGEAAIVLVMHHIISDGWSLGVMQREQQSYYNALAEGKEVVLEELPIQYKDYAIWHQVQLERPETQEHHEYWKEQLAGDLPVLDLHTDYPRPNKASVKGASLSIEIPQNIFIDVERFSQKEEASTYMVLLSAVKALLYRYTGQSDMILGTAVAGRDHVDLEEQIGFYVNSLPLRTTFEAEDHSISLVKKVKETVSGAFEHQIYPFDRMVEEWGGERNPGRHPIFDVLVLYQNQEAPSAKIGSETKDIQEAPITTGVGDSEFDLSFNFLPSDSSLKLTINYKSDLFSVERVEQIARHYLQLLSGMMQRPSLPIGLQQYLTTSEEEQLTSFASDKAESKQVKTVWEQISEQVEINPTGTAIKFNDVAISYAEMDKATTNLAQFLQAKYGIGQGDCVALMAEPSENTMVAILGILKAGAAYVPIKSDAPISRKQLILEDAEIKLMISDTPEHEGLFEGVWQDLLGWDQWTTPDSSLSLPTPQAEDLMYILYTSGSTGRPKGCMLTHKGVAVLVDWMKEYFEIGSDEVVLQKTTLIFDVSIEEIFLPLAAGATLLICPEESRFKADRLLDLIKKEQVTMLQFVPTTLQAALDELRKSSDKTVAQSLKRVFCGGEALSQATVEDYYNHLDCPLYNMYGPTETTIDASYALMKVDQKEVSLGRPVAETSLWVLDEQGAKVPVGVPGEICIGGPGLALGYLNLPEETQSRFISHPYEHGKQLYRTGDRGYWRADGELMFLGRIDYQVKVRGFRVELGEIEKQLEEHPTVKQAVVKVQTQESGDQILAAYLLGEDIQSINSIRFFLQNRLPSYMVPNYWSIRENFPLNASGKINRSLLPKLSSEHAAVEEDFLGPRTETEKQLAQIWAEVLDLKKVGINDHFLDLGGHSLKAVKIASRIHQDMGIEVNIRSLFEHPSIAALAKEIGESGVQSKPQAFQHIETVPDQEHYPLSYAQRRLWILDQLSDSNSAYNLNTSIWWDEIPEVDKVEAAFLTLIERHESLRTSFISIKGEARQKVISMDEVNFEVQHVDLQDEVNPMQQFSLIHEVENKASFDLTQAPLVRVKLVQVAESKACLLITMHHIISDGWSLEVLEREWMTAYDAICEGKEVQLPKLPIQYRDYAVWHNTQVEDTSKQGHREYWSKQFEGAIPVLQLPTDRPRPNQRSFQGAGLNLLLGDQEAQQISQLARRYEASEFMVIMTAVNLLLHRYTGDTDIVIGTPLAGRDHIDLESQIGFYVNTLALRTSFSEDDTVAGLLEKVKQTTVGGYGAGMYPFDLLVEDLNVKIDASRNPLFDVMVSYQSQNGALQSNSGKGSQEVQDTPHISTSKFDLHFDFVPTADGLRLDIHYNTDLFDRARMVRMTQHLQKLLQMMTEQIDMPISKVEYIPEAEKIQLIEEFNQTESEFPEDATLISLFEERVAETPDRVAMVFMDKPFTYREMNQEINRLAHYLRKKYDIKPNDRIALMADRSEWLMMAILAILKSGAGYVPIEVEFPVSRKQYILNDADVKVFITEEKQVEKVRAYYDGPLFTLEEMEGLDTPTHNPTHEITSRDLVYMIYTSGSTGQPKGCEVENRSMINLIYWIWDEYDFDYDDVLLQKTTFVFDVSVWEFFLPLCRGIKMILCHKDEVSDPKRISELVEKHKATTAHFSPTIFLSYLEAVRASRPEQLVTMRRIFSAGEALDLSIVQYHYEQLDCALHNVYGPTEATIYATGYTTKATDKSVPIGKPLYNMQTYILDKNQQLLPIGVPGEICIGGVGLSRGYHNRPDLTAKKFIPSPFRPGERIYRSGDLGYIREDGNIEYMGRVDHQVKIRGYRIELGEIEANLMSYPKVEQAAVIVDKDLRNDHQMIAYYTSYDNCSAQELKDYLSSLVPEFMVPLYFVPLDTFPLTASGKLNRKELPQPEEWNAFGHTHYIAPRNELERLLVEVWEDVLDREEIGVRDNFHELGGHSIKAIRILGQIHQEIGLEIRLKDLFEHPTVEYLANFIRKQQPEDSDSFQQIPKAEEQPYYPLSHAQRRLWIIQQLDQTQQAYHMAFNCWINGTLDVDVLQSCLNELIGRHESLRTRFVSIDGEPHQEIMPADQVSLELQVKDIQGEENPAQAANKYANLLTEQAYELETAPLLRAMLLVTKSDQGLLLLNMHHIISDGWSLGVFKDELLSLYYAKLKNLPGILPELPIQYRDYSVWHNELINNEDSDQAKTYWHKQFEGDIPTLALPTDYPRPAIKSYSGAVVSIPIDNLQQDLEQLSRNHQLSLFMTLVGSVNTLLYRYTQQDDIVLGTVVAGRNRPELADQIGFFVNTLALRTQITSGETSLSLLEKVKDVINKGIGYQDYPFDLLVDDLSVERDTSRHPLFDVMVQLHNLQAENNKSEESSSEKVADTSQSKGSSVPFHMMEIQTTSKFDLTFNFFNTPTGLRLDLNYNTDLFSRERILALGGHLIQVLKGMIEHPKRPISRLELLSEVEQKFLRTFNETQEIFEQEQTIIDKFEQQAASQPEATAVVFNEKPYSFGWINQQANRLARELQATYNIETGDKVGIITGPSELMVVSLLAVLKAGGAYVPIKEDDPVIRQKTILEDSEAKLILTSPSFDSNTIKECYDGPVMIVDQLDKLAHSSENLPNKPGPEDLMYVMFTSGSTGTPKGVMVEHGGVTNLVQWMQSYFQMEQNEVILQRTTYVFDVSVWEIFLPLSLGYKMVLCTEEEIYDPAALINLIEREQVTMLHFIPSLLPDYFGTIDQPEVQQQLTSLRRILCGGEVLEPAMVERHYQYLDCELYNMYGPTEATVDTTYYLTRAEDQQIPIGSPISNVQVYILDERMEKLPIGVPGEIYIGGSGLARGYANRPELTKERFVANPYAAGERLYKSGDLGQWRDDGQVIFLGRKDQQIKLRGYRIELNEIEHLLNENPKVKQAVVVLKEDQQGDQHLIAYFTQNEESKSDELFIYLQDRLPHYMVPSFIEQVASFPMLSNGKINRKGLPMPKSWEETSGSGEELTFTSTETEILEIWKGLLNRDNIKHQDNFFKLGGNSLKAIRAVSQLQQKLGINISLQLIFQYPTLAQLGIYIDNLLSVEGDFGTSLSSATDISPIKRVGAQDSYPVAFQQRGLFLNKQFSLKPAAFNMIQEMEISNWDEDAFRKTLQWLIDRHESLRTTFFWDGAEVQMRVQGTNDFYLPWMDYIIGTPPAPATIEMQWGDHEFDRQHGPLFQFITFTKPNGNKQVWLIIDHIISDAWSIQQMTQEAQHAYESFITGQRPELAPLEIQFKDYATWQLDQLNGESGEESKNFWKEEFKELPSRISLPYTEEFKPEPSYKQAIEIGAAQRYKNLNDKEQEALYGNLATTMPLDGGSAYQMVIPDGVYQELKQAAAEYEVSLFSFLMAGVNLWLNKTTGQQEFVVGSPANTRTRSELDSLIGWFLNNLLIRNKVDSQQSIREFVQGVNQQNSKALAHRMYPIEQVLSDVDVSLEYIGQVFLHLIDYNEGQQTINQDLPAVHRDNGTPTFDLNFTFKTFSNGMMLVCDYRKECFDPQTIEAFTQGYLSCLKELVQHPDQSIETLTKA